MSTTTSQEAARQTTPSEPSPQPTRWLIWGMLLLLFVGLCGLLLYCNDYDWESFFTFNEVDRRAWLQGSPPLWSYQLCGGVTGAGDPQAFGLSPLFLWVLGFGSFWGTKWMIVFCLLLGYIFLQKTLLLLAFGDTEKEQVPATARLSAHVLTALFVASNGFLYHLAVGHVTYALNYLALGLFYYSLKAWLGTWRKVDWLGSIVLTFSYYTAGFYIAQVFFVLPFFLALGASCLISLLTRDPEVRAALLPRFAKMVTFHLLGIVLASYKLYFLFSYQIQHPRTIGRREQIDILTTLLSPFLPMWNGRLLGIWRGQIPGTYWEYSYFYLGAWLLLLGLFFQWRHRAVSVPPFAPSRPPGLRLFLWLYGLVVLGFALGDSWSWSLHALLNNHVFHQSVRVIARYQLGFTLFFALWLGAQLLRDPRFHRLFARRLALPLLGLLLLNGLTFHPFASSAALHRLLALPTREPVKMKRMVLAPQFRLRRLSAREFARDVNTYALTLLGVGQLSCYNAIAKNMTLRNQLLKKQRVAAFHTLQRGARPSMTTVYPLIDTHTTPVPDACVEQSYFTQQRIHLHPSCPRHVCLHISQPNIYRQSHLYFDKKVQRYCRR